MTRATLAHYWEVIDMKARRGDVVLIVRTTRDYIIGQAARERTDCSFALVSSITRDGMVKKVRRIAYGSDVLESAPSDLGLHDRVYVLPATDVDVTGLLAAAKAHHWPDHPNQPMPFGGVDEARELARPFRKEVAA
jgi:hypothetical protein